MPEQAVWPPILWADAFRAEPAEWEERASQQRATWLSLLRAQGMVDAPVALLLFAGRWSAEKRIHLLFDALPPDCALVVVGDTV